MNSFKILYLDDDDSLLEFFSIAVEDWGLNIDTFTNPQKVFDALKKHTENSREQYKVLLIDYKMPIINGIDFLQLLNDKKYFGIEHIVLFSSVVHCSSVQGELARKIPNASQKIMCIEKAHDNMEELKDYLLKSYRENLISSEDIRL